MHRFSGLYHLEQGGRGKKKQKKKRVKEHGERDLSGGES